MKRRRRMKTKRTATHLREKKAKEVKKKEKNALKCMLTVKRLFGLFPRPDSPSTFLSFNPA